MLTTLKSKSVYEGNRLKYIAGKSTDSKPVNCLNGSRFIEVNTGKEFVFDEEDQQWTLIQGGGGGGSDMGLKVSSPTFSSTDIGYIEPGTSISSIKSKIQFSLTFLAQDDTEFGTFATNASFCPVNPESTTDLLAYATITDAQGNELSSIANGSTGFVYTLYVRDDLSKEFTEYEQEITLTTEVIYTFVASAWPNQPFVFTQGDSLELNNSQTPKLTFGLRGNDGSWLNMDGIPMNENTMTFSQEDPDPDTMHNKSYTNSVLSYTEGDNEFHVELNMQLATQGDNPVFQNSNYINCQPGSYDIIAYILSVHVNENAINWTTGNADNSIKLATATVNPGM